MDRKILDEEITLELKRHLSSKSVMPTDVLRVQVVLGGNHDNTAPVWRVCVCRII